MILHPPQGPGGASAPPWATAAAVAVGPGGIDWGGDTLYKAPKDYTKPQSIIQGHQILHIFEKKLLPKSIQSTFHKWVLVVNAGPNPTPMNKFDKHIVKTHKSKFTPKYKQMLKSVTNQYFC